jgi:hypothetical protein
VFIQQHRYLTTPLQNEATERSTVNFSYSRQHLVTPKPTLALAQRLESRPISDPPVFCLQDTPYEPLPSTPRPTESISLNKRRHCQSPTSDKIAMKRTVNPWRLKPDKMACERPWERYREIHKMRSQKMTGRASSTYFPRTDYPLRGLSCPPQRNPTYGLAATMFPNGRNQ